MHMSLQIAHVLGHADAPWYSGPASHLTEHANTDRHAWSIVRRRQDVPVVAIHVALHDSMDSVAPDPTRLGNKCMHLQQHIMYTISHKDTHTKHAAPETANMGPLLVQQHPASVAQAWLLEWLSMHAQWPVAHASQAHLQRLPPVSSALHGLSQLQVRTPRRCFAGEHDGCRCVVQILCRVLSTEH